MRAGGGLSSRPDRLMAHWARLWRMWIPDHPSQSQPTGISSLKQQNGREEIVVFFKKLLEKTDADTYIKPRASHREAS
jgi:hypothetical protein